MESLPESVEILREFLQSLPPTEQITGEVRQDLYHRLFSAWDSLDGSDEQRTSADKLHRAENMAWDPPLLSFTLERHGATVNGSSRAALHYWQVNVETGSAGIRRIGRRQLEPMDSRLDVKKLAAEIRRAIVAGEENDSLDWFDKPRVVIAIGKIIPETSAQTTQSRRKRFRAALDEEMAEAGWDRADHGNKRGYIPRIRGNEQ